MQGGGPRERLRRIAEDQAAAGIARGGPAGREELIEAACLAQFRTAVSVRSRSRATSGTVFPRVLTNPTTSAFYSTVNVLRFLMDKVSLTSEVSTNSG